METKLFDRSYPVTSDYGSNYGGPNRQRPNHGGVDFGSVGYTTPFKAIGNGRLYHNTNPIAGLGLRLRLDTGEDVYYSHASARLHSSGVRVKAGQDIGITGSSGNSTGPHLHAEVRSKGQVLDPWDYFLSDDEMAELKTKGEGVLNIGALIKDAAGNVKRRITAENVVEVLPGNTGKVWLYGVVTNPKDKVNMWKITKDDDNYISLPDFVSWDTEIGIKQNCGEIVITLQRRIDSLESEVDHLSKNAIDAVDILENKQ